MERVTGIEPVSSVWKTDIIAIIQYPPMVPGRGLEPPRLTARAPKARVSTSFTTRLIPHDSLKLNFFQVCVI